MSKWTHKKTDMPKGRLRDRFLCFTVSGEKDYYNIDIRTLKWMRAVYHNDHNTFIFWQDLPRFPREMK